MFGLLEAHMSRIGKQPVSIPAGVSVEITDGLIRVSGPKGTLERTLDRRVGASVADGAVSVSVAHPDDPKERALWGTFAAHVRNLIAGASQGFSKQLEINGVGYRASLSGTKLKLEVGFSHPVMYDLPDGVTATVEKNVITLSSADKELLGRAAAEIRAIRKPEPYKGKGIKYATEVIRRKAGKTAKTGAAA